VESLTGLTPWRSAAAQVLVSNLDSPELEPDDLHHLQRVLRLRAGEEVCATDGTGGWRSCAFLASRELEALGEPHQELPPEYPVTVGFAVVKGERPELIVQKLTELGVDRIWPFMAQRSVVRWDEEKTAKQLERLRRVARESCAQSRRLWLPEVGFASGGAGVDGAAAGGAAADSTPPGRAQRLASFEQVRNSGAVLANMGGSALKRADRVVLVGPEGGWDSAESEGANCVSLGEHVLRAETAAITAGVLLTALRAGIASENLR
jgi:16S rRNA (uracil1498-N3)-methyltransferase